MQTNSEMAKALRTARIFYIFLMAAILIYAVIIYWILPFKVPMALFPISDSLTTILTVVVSAFAIYSIMNGSFFLPRWLLKASAKANVNNSKALLSIIIIRGGLFEAVAIYGIILGVFGAAAQITVPFMVVSLGALILTFPTEEKWKKMIAPKDIYSKYD
jgi:hypothetical protein